MTTALNARQEVPRPKGNANRARGTFSATVTKTGATSGSIAWRLTFSKLTGRAVAAHIHIGAAGRPGPVAIPLCGPCRSGARKSATLSAAVLAALEAGRAYVNIHTARNPAGEIRAPFRSASLELSSLARRRTADGRAPSRSQHRPRPSIGHPVRDGRGDGRGPPNLAISILEFREDKIARESIYVSDGWDPPEWRAQ